MQGSVFVAPRNSRIVIEWLVIERPPPIELADCDRVACGKKSGNPPPIPNSASVRLKMEARVFWNEVVISTKNCRVQKQLITRKSLTFSQSK